MPKRRLYDEVLRKVLSDTTAEYVEGRVVPAGWVLFVTSAALEDETTAPTTQAFGKKVGTRFEAMEEDDSPSVGIRFHTENTHHFLAGEKPGWRVEGGTDSDVLSGYMEGYYERV